MQLGESKIYNPDLWLRDSDVVLKYLPTESDGPFLIRRLGKYWRLGQWDKFKYDRLWSQMKVGGSVVKLFPWRFSLSKQLNSPIASGIMEILQKLKSKKIKDCNGSLVNSEQPRRSRVIRFVQSLKLKNFRSTRAPTDLWIMDKLAHRSISRYWSIDNPLKSGVFSSFLQSARRRTFRDHNDAAFPKSRLTRLVQFCKLKNTSFVRSPIDGSTCDKFMHPVRSSRSRFRIPSKHGVIFSFLELLKSILFKLGRFCEARINHKHFSIVVLKLEFRWFRSLNCNNNKLKTSYKFTCINPIFLSKLSFFITKCVFLNV